MSLTQLDREEVFARIREEFPKAENWKVIPGRGMHILLRCPIGSIVCSYKHPRWIPIYNVRYWQSSKLTYKFQERCKSCSKFLGGSINKAGYVRISGLQKNAVFEHRIIMERILGRKLSKSETVHHINGKRADNRPENLELRMAGNYPQGWSLRQMREYLKTVPKKLGGLK